MNYKPLDFPLSLMDSSITSYFSTSPSTTKEDEAKALKTKMSIIIERYRDRVSVLPKDKQWFDDHLYQYQGFWYYQGFWNPSAIGMSVEMVMASQDEFQAHKRNVILASHPKSGTTWLKSLAFAIVNRTKFKDDEGSCPIHPLLTTSPHDCVPNIESLLCFNNTGVDNELIATHIPYTSLPTSIITSNCHIVYICRDPKDVVISFWHHMNKMRILREASPLKLEDVFESFSRGASPYGSCWDHVIGYYKASLERPDKVMFLIYEVLKKDAKNEIKKLAKFIGYPFTEKEEAGGEIEKIINLCSFDKLREVNKHGRSHVFFREGKVGDSVNYLTSEMIKVLDKITKEKYDELGISF